VSGDIPFYRTQMGHRFYEATMPTLVRELARLNENLERLLVAVERKPAAEAPAPPKTEAPR
jgi:hypothetical protein